jgi:hypothetical protein
MALPKSPTDPPTPPPRQSTKLPKDWKTIDEIASVKEPKRNSGATGLRTTSDLKRLIVTNSIANKKNLMGRYSENPTIEISFLADLSQATRKMANMTKEEENKIHSGKVLDEYSDYRHLLKPDLIKFHDDRISFKEASDLALGRLPRGKLANKLRRSNSALVSRIGFREATGETSSRRGSWRHTLSGK